MECDCNQMNIIIELHCFVEHQNKNYVVMRLLFVVDTTVWCDIMK